MLIQSRAHHSKETAEDEGHGYDEGGLQANLGAGSMVGYRADSWWLRSAAGSKINGPETAMLSAQKQLEDASKCFDGS